jgi:NAD(P)-dependent dehydrogenase (short-subunit alcohol dehydrogenase family)
MTALSRQTAIVTGAAQGLGAAIARLFASAGANTILIDYDREGLERTRAECGGGKIVVADLSDAAAAEAAIAEALDGTERIDTLVHNAAILEPKPFGEMTLADFHRTVNVGLQAGFQLARAVWPGMVAAGRGTLIFVSSRSGIEGFADETAYCAAKHGLEGFSKSLALEGASLGIRSMTVTPGMYMRTPMSERNYTPELRQKWVEPDRLAPAFQKLAEADDDQFTGRRLDAWQLANS